MRPVKIPAARFFDTDKLEYPVAHDLKLGQFVQGALLEKELRSESRVYIVIALAPGSTVNEGRWWPRVVG